MSRAGALNEREGGGKGKAYRVDAGDELEHQEHHDGHVDALVVGLDVRLRKGHVDGHWRADEERQEPKDQENGNLRPKEKERGRC